MSIFGRFIEFDLDYIGLFFEFVYLFVNFFEL